PLPRRRESAGKTNPRLAQAPRMQPTFARDLLPSTGRGTAHCAPKTCTRVEQVGNYVNGNGLAWILPYAFHQCFEGIDIVDTRQVNCRPAAQTATFLIDKDVTPIYSELLDGIPR